MTDRTIAEWRKLLEDPYFTELGCPASKTELAVFALELLTDVAARESLATGLAGVLKGLAIGHASECACSCCEALIKYEEAKRQPREHSGVRGEQ